MALIPAYFLVYLGELIISIIVNNMGMAIVMLKKRISFRDKKVEIYNFILCLIVYIVIFWRDTDLYSPVFLSPFIVLLLIGIYISKLSFYSSVFVHFLVFCLAFNFAIDKDSFLYVSSINFYTFENNYIQIAMDLFLFAVFLYSLSLSVFVTLIGFVYVLEE